MKIKSKNKLNIGIVVVAVTMIVSVSSAAVVVDPDMFAEGTNISNAFPGVTLSAVGGGWNNAGPDIYVRDPLKYSPSFQASTGQFVFGTDDLDFPHEFREVDWLHLRADFAALASLVSIDFIGNNSHDVAVLYAYDASNNLLDSAMTGVLVQDQVETLTVSSLGNNIAYIIAAGDSGSSSVGIDHMQYVPEPATIVLLGLGATTLIRKRKRN